MCIYLATCRTALHNAVLSDKDYTPSGVPDRGTRYPLTPKCQTILWNRSSDRARRGRPDTTSGSAAGIARGNRRNLRLRGTLGGYGPRSARERTHVIPCSRSIRRIQHADHREAQRGDPPAQLRRGVRTEGNDLQRCRTRWSHVRRKAMGDRRLGLQWRLRVLRGEARLSRITKSGSACCGSAQLHDAQRKLQIEYLPGVQLDTPCREIRLLPQVLQFYDVFKNIAFPSRQELHKMDEDCVHKYRLDQLQYLFPEERSWTYVDTLYESFLRDIPYFTHPSTGSSTMPCFVMNACSSSTSNGRLRVPMSSRLRE